MSVIQMKVLLQRDAVRLQRWCIPGAAVSNYRLDEGLFLDGTVLSSGVDKADLLCIFSYHFAKSLYNG